MKKMKGYEDFLQALYINIITDSLKWSPFLKGYVWLIPMLITQWFIKRTGSEESFVCDWNYLYVFDTLKSLHKWELIWHMLLCHSESFLFIIIIFCWPTILATKNIMARHAKRHFNTSLWFDPWNIESCHYPAKCVPTKAFFLSGFFQTKIKVFCFDLITIYVLDLLCRLQGLTEFAADSFLTGLMFIHGMNAVLGMYEPPLAACWCLDLCAKAPPVLSFNDSFQSLTVSGKEKKVCLHSSSEADLLGSMNNSLWLHTPGNDCPVLKGGFAHCINVCFGSNSIYVCLFCAKAITSHLHYLFNSFAFACFCLIIVQ